MRQDTVRLQQQALAEAGALPAAGGMHFVAKVSSYDDLVRQLVQAVERDKANTKARHAAAHRRQDKDRLYGEMLGFDAVLHFLQNLRVEVQGPVPLDETYAGHHRQEMQVEGCAAREFTFVVFHVHGGWRWRETANFGGTCVGDISDAYPTAEGAYLAAIGD